MSWKQTRLDFFAEIRGLICKPNELLPWYGVIIRFLILPFDTLYYFLRKDLQVYDVCSDTYTIRGQKFSSAFFHLLRVGDKFEIVEIKNGIRTLKRLEI